MTSNAGHWPEDPASYMELSGQQQRILRFLWGYPHPYMPSYREIREAVGLKSVFAVRSQLSELEGKGWVRRDSRRPRALEVRQRYERLPVRRELPGVGLGLRRFTLSRRSNQREPRLTHISIALTVTVVVAILIVTAVTAVGLSFLRVQHLQVEHKISAANLFDLLKVAFAVAAGIGGVVALVTAYRRQRISEFAEKREQTRLFNERFATAAGQLGHDNPAVRLAGVYAMAGLADDWSEQCQTCVDVLCAYLRMPYQPEYAEEKLVPGSLALSASREVRDTVVRVISAHLRPDHLRSPTAVSWQGLNLDFTGALFESADFSDAQFSGGDVSFRGASFSGGDVSFKNASFSGGEVSFRGASFSGGDVSFEGAEFSGREVSFNGARFSDGAVFNGAHFSSGSVLFSNVTFGSGGFQFYETHFTGSEVSFRDAEFTGGQVHFVGARFAGGKIDFSKAKFTAGQVNLGGADYTGSYMLFCGARFRGGQVHFSSARLIGGYINFRGAYFTHEISFISTIFSGSRVDFTDPSDWSQPPLIAFSDGKPPVGVLIPAR